MTAPGASPAANAPSASRRRSGQEYDPGSSRAVAGGPPSRARCRSSAREREAVRHPAARQTWSKLATRSRPPRRVRNSCDRWAAHSQTLTPQGRWSRARSPCPFPTQIAHAGTEPRFSPL